MNPEKQGENADKSTGRDSSVRLDFQINKSLRFGYKVFNRSIGNLVEILDVVLIIWVRDCSTLKRVF